MKNSLVKSEPASSVVLEFKPSRLVFLYYLGLCALSLSCLGVLIHQSWLFLGLVPVVLWYLKQLAEKALFLNHPKSIHTFSLWENNHCSVIFQTGKKVLGKILSKPVMCKHFACVEIHLTSPPQVIHLLITKDSVTRELFQLLLYKLF